ncbi:MAG: DJ-1/PfpI family protein [Proteobacteria bacterium]|nr:DJ-1/PfpI family protein [Pseudomonadota bacterium]
MSRTVGILLFEDVEELDFAGPFEVFGMASKLSADLRVVTIAEGSDPVRAFNGLRVVPDHSFENAPALDILLVPGGMGTRKLVDNAAVIDWLRKTAADCEWVTSVCTGTLLLHEAGVAAGKRTTTHWAFVEALRERGDIEVLEEVRYVRDGNLVTAAGVSAGIDMSLWLLGQIEGIPRARQVQKMMQYDPAPPYPAEV